MTSFSRTAQSRSVGVGHSDVHDPVAAATEATRQAVGDADPALLLVFCSPSYDLAALLETVCSHVPDTTRIAGCSTHGELAKDERGRTVDSWRPSVVVAALGGSGFSADSTVVPNASADRYESGARAATAVADVEAPHRAVLMLADGLTREQHEIVRGAYSVLGLDVPIVGGCSGDDLQYTKTYQFHGTGAGVQVYTDAIVAVGLGSDAPVGIGIAHGWRKQGAPMMVTSSEGGEVQLLDGEPAVDVYLRAIGETRELLADMDKFRDVAFANPLGMSRRSGEDIRVVHAVDPERGSLLCLADVPQGALVWPMTTDVDSLVDAARDAAADAIAQLDGAPPIGALVFDCGARKVRLGREHLGAEQAALGEMLGDLAFAGFYTFGEIARTQGSRGMHHLTVVTLTLA